MTLPNLPVGGVRRTRSLLSGGATEVAVTERLGNDTRFRFLKTHPSQYTRFSNSLGELLQHYMQTLGAYAEVHSRAEEGGEAKRQRQLEVNRRTYETAIVQLLEKAYQEAKAEGITAMRQRSANSAKNRVVYSTRRGGSRISAAGGRGVDAGRRSNFTRDQVVVLQEWFRANLDDPYPDPETKFELAKASGLSFKQVSNWFINARSRRLTAGEKKKLKRVY